MSQTICLSIQNAKDGKGHNSNKINLFFVFFFVFFFLFISYLIIIIIISSSSSSSSSMFLLFFFKSLPGDILLSLTCQNDMYLSGCRIHFLGLFYFLYVLLLAKTCASYVLFPNFWGLATLMKFK